MPRFYWVTFVLSVAIGYLLKIYVDSHDATLFKFMALALIIIFINEKTSRGENMLRKNMTAVVLIILIATVYLLWRVGL